MNACKSFIVLVLADIYFRIFSGEKGLNPNLFTRYTCICLLLL